MKILRLIFCLFMITAGASCLRAQDQNVKTVDTSEFRALLKADPEGLLLDVRRPDEFKEGHLQGAKNINWLDTDTFKAEASGLSKDKTLYVYCRSGRRSAEAAAWLASQGFKVVDMRGGWLAWERCCGSGECKK